MSTENLWPELDRTKREAEQKACQILDTLQISQGTQTSYTQTPYLQAIKADEAKPTFDLLPMDALAEIQKVLDFGAQKYSPWNWAKGFTWLRLWNALMRHSWAWVSGEDNDPETGLSHLAHMGACILFLLSHKLRGLGQDDRRKVDG